MRYCNHPLYTLQHPLFAHHHDMRYSSVVGRLGVSNRYYEICNGKGEYKEFTSYQHGVVSITWLIMTKLQAHRWVNRMSQMHICTEKGLWESSWGRSRWEECVLEHEEWMSKMSDYVIDEDVQIVCWAKWRELSHTHVIGVWTKWVGMIVCDDVEMKGREKEWFWSEWVGDEFEVL